MTDVNLAIKMTADASDAVDGASDVGSAFTDMAREVDNAADKADAATNKLGGVADAADNVDTKMGGATASLGALSGGLEAAGFEGAAGALGTLGQATDFAAGAGQGLALVLQLEAVQTVRAKVAAVGKAVADKAMAAASKVAAASQWALNAAMSANPIGLVVLAVAALVAGFVLAYKKSDTFRAVVDAAMEAAKAAIDVVVGVVKDIVGAVKDAADKFPALSSAVGVAKDLVVTYFELMTLPLRTVIDLIDKIIDKIGDIDFPDLPDLNPLNRGSAGRGSSGGFQLPGQFHHEAGGDLNINLPGAVLVGSEAEVARYIKRVLGLDSRGLGPA